MVRAWLLTENNEDLTKPNMTEPPVFMSMEELRKTTGVEHMTFSPENLDSNETFNKLKKDRSYTYEDVCEISRATLPDYDKMVKAFNTEHIHADEEIRFVVSGTGYFDVRNEDDKFVRIEASAGDFIILPAGIYHRFSLDKNNYIKARRLFSGDPVWTAYYRPKADDHPSRLGYLKTWPNCCCGK